MLIDTTLGRFSNKEILGLNNSGSSATTTITGTGTTATSDSIIYSRTLATTSASELWINGTDSNRLLLTLDKQTTLNLILTAYDTVSKISKTWNIQVTAKRTSSGSSIVNYPVITIVSNDTTMDNFIAYLTLSTDYLCLFVQSNTTNSVKWYAKGDKIVH
jgi:hypothetical protein